MTSRSRIASLLALALVGGLLFPAAALAHREREAHFPDGTGSVPTYRTDGPSLVVCKPDSPERFALLPPDDRARNAALFEACEFNHIQDALNAVEQQGTRILVLPGLYQEQPSRRAPSAECAELQRQTDEADIGSGFVMSYEEHLACPHVQQAIAILGDSDGDRTCDLPVCGVQIEGTGASPRDVVIDGSFDKLNVIRADRADGVYFKNFTVQRAEFNALYVLETDGFVIDEVVGRWNDEYGFLTFAVDHGLYVDCEGYHNGDSTLYPGSASDISTDVDSHDVERYAVEIRNCVSHHNTLGYSGTAGNSVWLHDSLLARNGIGIATDSLFPDHPGLPQDHAVFDSNTILGNNYDYYEFVRDGSCADDKPVRDRDYENGVVCPVIPAPFGTGTLIAGGNWNLITGNTFADNWRQGTMQFGVPAAARNEPDPTKQFDTSHNNRYEGNRMGFGPRGLVQPNGLDFWWDDQGEGNCWTGNVTATGEISDNAAVGLPDCDDTSMRPPVTPKQVPLLPCATYDRSSGETPEGCPFFDEIAPPPGREPAEIAVARRSGGNRFGTSVAVSAGSFPDGASAVVLARADDYADALVGAPLAAHIEAPILLADRNGLTADVAAEVTRLGATRAVVLGGSNALGGGVEADLADLGITDVLRVSGADRFATAAEVARAIGSDTQAYLAKGIDADPARGWPDALAVSGLAATQLRPILLTTTGRLPESTRQVLADLHIDALTIVGGTAAVSAEVESAVAEQVHRVDRLSGPDRFATSEAVAQRSLLRAMDPNSVWNATGLNWPDALVAGPAVARDGGVLRLVNPLDADAPTVPGDSPVLDTVVDRITKVGGPGVLP